MDSTFEDSILSRVAHVQIKLDGSKQRRNYERMLVADPQFWQPIAKGGRNGRERERAERGELCAISTLSIHDCLS